MHLFPCLTLSRNLGVTLDCHLTMKTQISNLLRSADIDLHRVIVPSLIFCSQMPQRLVSAFVLLHLGYYNSLLSGCPQYLLNKLQKVKNSTASLVMKVPKTDCISPYHLASLHWLPIDSWIQYKLSSLCYNCLNSTAPAYLTELVKIYKSACQLCSSSIHVPPFSVFPPHAPTRLTRTVYLEHSPL